MIPQRIHRGGREIVIAWSDDHVGTYQARVLRIACHCAVCRDEGTGRRLLDPGTVPAELAAASIALVGAYGIKIRWSDGHDTGIYTYEYLMALCPCDACVRGRGKEGREATREGE
ncbi:MAG TPA: DUF971 domain-containing protein [Gemmatimonadales bacterium]